MRIALAKCPFGALLMALSGKARTPWRSMIDLVEVTAEAKPPRCQRGGRAMQDSFHRQRVDAWMERHTTALRAPELAQLLGLALGALWDRANVTLGEVTLVAIFHRVLSNTKRKFPVMAALRLEPKTETFSDLAAGGSSAASLDRAELARAMQFVLTELLTVLGTLTGEILTPALHAELSTVSLAERAPTAPWATLKSAQRTGRGGSTP